MLECRDLGVRYGPIQALRAVSLQVVEGSITGIVGANGAGKTSLLRAIMGLEPVSGAVLLRNKDITHEPTHRRARNGLAFVPAGGELFANLTVLQNLRLGARVASTQPRVERIEAIFDLFPQLADRRRQKVRTMSGGEQQMVAVARAMVMRPTMLLLDEPSFGLAPLVLGNILETLRRLNAEHGLTILLVEQNARLALDLAGSAYILAHGRVVAGGATSELRDQPGTAAVYFGGDPNEH